MNTLKIKTPGTDTFPMQRTGLSSALERNLPPRKVIYLLTSLGQGGTERNAATFCGRIDRSLFVPEVWYLHEKTPSVRDKIESAGVKTVCLNAPGRRSVSFLLRTARKLARAQADLIHVFLPSVGYYAALSKLLFRNPVPMLFSAGGTHTELPFQKQMYKYGIARYCFPVLCNSPSVRAFMLQMGVPETHLRVIPNGHDLQPFSTSFDAKAKRLELGLKEDVSTLVTVGRLAESKRHTDLFRAQKMLLDEGRLVQTLVIGDGPLQDRLIAETRELGISNQVVFAGQRNDVPQLLRMADCFVFPSETEGLPNAVIEAALAGLPIVACRINGVVDVVLDQESALLSDVKNPEQLATSIRTILDDRILARRLANTARTFAEDTYNIENVIRQIEQVYGEAIGYTRKRGH